MEGFKKVFVYVIKGLFCNFQIVLILKIKYLVFSHDLALYVNRFLALRKSNQSSHIKVP